MSIGVSVIIPCYNAAAYVERCLDSFDFSYPNYELIFVDDCSSDHTVALLMQYIKKHKINAKVYQNRKNTGPGPARNYGIEHAKKEYLAFVDIDDTVDKDYFRAFSEAAKGGYGCIVFDAARVSGRRRKRLPMFLSNKVKNGVVDRKEALVYIRPSPFGKFYRSDMVKVNNIRFPDVMRGEDYAFGKAVAGLSDSIYYISRELYCYYDNAGSLVHRDELVNDRDRLKIYQYIYSKLKGRHLARELNEIYFFSVVFAIMNDRLSHGMPSRQCNCLYNVLTKEYIPDSKYVYSYHINFLIYFLLLKNRCFGILKCILAIRNRK